MKTLFALILVTLPSFLLAQSWPAEWWAPVARSESASWEILPQDAGPGEVVLSKRTELGVFSNFSAHSFMLDGKTFASIEGLWQSMKYPDLAQTKDKRNFINEWPFTREQVASMVGFDAKAAGNAAMMIYQKHQLNLISWGENFFDYLDHSEGSAFHYRLIKKVLKAKLDQNPELWQLLLKTNCLVLRPDHKVSPNDPPAYRYYEIYMELRNERFLIPCL